MNSSTIKDNKNTNSIEKKSVGSEAYAESEFLTRAMYSYKEVSAPSWVMQALVKWEGNSEMFFVEAKQPINWDRISPKCWEASSQSTKNSDVKLQNKPEINYCHNILPVMQIKWRKPSAKSLKD